MKGARISGPSINKSYYYGLWTKRQDQQAEYTIRNFSARQWQFFWPLLKDVINKEKAKHEKDHERIDTNVQKGDTYLKGTRNSGPSINNGPRTRGKLTKEEHVRTIIYHVASNKGAEDILDPSRDTVNVPFTCELANTLEKRKTFLAFWIE